MYCSLVDLHRQTSMTMWMARLNSPYGVLDARWISSYPWLETATMNFAVLLSDSKPYFVLVALLMRNFHFLFYYYIWPLSSCHRFNFLFWCFFFLSNTFNYILSIKKCWEIFLNFFGSHIVEFFYFSSRINFHSEISFRIAKNIIYI